ncbi:MAG: peptide chain release factor 1 [Gemmatimonadota bacterium]
MRIRQKLAAAVAQAADVEQRLLDPDTARDSRRLAALGRDHQRLSAIVDRARRLERLDDELAQARELVVVPDPELAAEARAEVTRVEADQARLEEELKPLLVPPDPLDDRAAIVEIRAGTGGDEAALFAHDLWRMYTRYIERHGGWRVALLSGSDSTLGGVREVAFKVEGAGAVGAVRREAGVHRVQRVPATESAGRIHTSAATVAVLPEAEDVDVSIDEKDLRVDVYRASGPGGQGVNTTDSAVRITHLPTGIVVTQQDQRSQLQNKARAMEVLRSRLFDLRLAEQEAERSRLRRSAVSTGDRSAKIRTYNFPQNRVTDHRINYTAHDLPQVMEGRLDDLFAALRLADLNERLEDA